MSVTPYPGLRPFRRDEVDVFFGRDRHIDTMLSMLGRHRFLAVTGSSGAGKSSLVKTGLYAALELGYMRAAGAHWRIFETRPGSTPLKALCDALIDGLGTPVTEAERGLMDAALARSPEAVINALDVIARRDGQSLLVVIDQFEELFRYRYDATDDESYAFVALLLALARQRDVPIYVVITLRSDFLGECSRYDGLAEMVNGSLFLTPQMNRDELAEAISAPAAVFGGSVEPRLVGRLLNDLEKEQDQLPLMQHALARLWENAVSRNSEAPMLTLKSYEEIQGATGALGQHGDSILRELGPLAAVAETVFRRLCGRSGGVRDIRRPTPLLELQQVSGAPMADLVTVIEAFRRPDRSFLAPPDVALTPERIIDITHESLIRQWSTLTAWAKAEADDEAIYRRIVESALLHQTGRAALWKSPDLDFAVEWRDRVKPTGVWALRYGSGDDFDLALAFVKESAAESARAAAAARDAEDERRAAAADRQNARRLRLFAVVASILFAVAVIALIFAGVSGQQARANALLANEKAIAADKEAKDARLARGEAERSSIAAAASLQQARAWKEQALRAQGNLLVEAAHRAQQQGDSDRAAAIAAEALSFAARYDESDGGLGLTPSIESGLSLVFAEIERYPRIRLEAEGSLSELPMTSGFFGNDHWIAVESSDEATVLKTFDRWSGAVLASTELGAEPELAALAGDGSILAMANGGTVTLAYPLTAPDTLESFVVDADEAGWLASVSLGGEGEAMRLLTVDTTGTIELWDPRRGANRSAAVASLAGLLNPELAMPLAAALSPDGGMFAMLSSDGKVHLGTIEGDTIASLGTMRLAFSNWDSPDFSVYLLFDQARDRLIVLANNCLVGMRLSDIAPADGKTTSIGSVSDCVAAGPLVRKIVASATYRSARISSDGRELALMGASDAYIASIDPPSFGATAAIASIDTPGALIDFDPSEHWLVQGSAPNEFLHFPGPQPEFACAGPCDTLARLDGDRLLLRSAEGIVVMSLAEDGAPVLTKLPTGELTTLIGIRSDRMAVAVADEDYQHAIIVDFAGQQPVNFALRVLRTGDEGSTRFNQTTADAPVPGIGPADPLAPAAEMDAVPIVTLTALEDGGTSVGDLFRYADKDAWPAYLRPAEQRVAASSAAGVIAYETDGGVGIRLADGSSGAADGSSPGDVAALAFGSDDGALYALTEARALWRLTVPVTGPWSPIRISEGAIYALFPEGGAGRMGVVSSMDVAAGEVTIVIDGAIKRMAIDGRPSWDLSRLDAAVTWAGMVDGQLVSTAKALSVWDWQFPNTTFAEGRLTAATMPGDMLSNLDLLELYVLPEALAASLGPRLGSELCAAEVARNRLMQSGAGCPETIANHAADPRALIADALAMLTIGLSSSDGSSGQTASGVDVGDLIVSDAHMLLIHAAAAGAPEALAMVADELSPAIAARRNSKLLPALGWFGTIAVLERIYETKGSLPSALIELLADTSDEPAAASARQRWLTRIGEPAFSSDPIARLARALYLGGGQPAGEALAELASVIRQLTGPTVIRAQRIALLHFAERAGQGDPGQALAILRGEGADTPAGPPARIALHASLAAFVGAKGDRLALAAARPEALRTAIVALGDLLSGADKAAVARYFALSSLEVALIAGDRSVALDELLVRIGDSGGNVADSAAENALVVRLLTQIDLENQALGPLNTALLHRLIASFEAQGAWDADFSARVFEVFAAVPGADLADADKSWLSETQNLFAANYNAAPDSGVYGIDIQNAQDVSDRLVRVAHFAARLGLIENAAVIAGETILALETSGSAEELRPILATMRSAYDVLLEVSEGWTDSEWITQNWQALLPPVRYGAAQLSNGMEQADVAALNDALEALRTGAALNDRLGAALSDAEPDRNDVIATYDAIGYMEYRIASRLTELGDLEAAGAARARAAEAFAIELAAVIAAAADDPTDAKAASAAREMYAWVATVEADRGNMASALENERLGLGFARIAYDIDGSASAANLLKSYRSISVYLSQSGAEGGLAELAGYFGALDTLPPDARDRFEATDIGEFLKNTAYLVGQLAGPGLPAEDADDCDALAAHPNDPLRRATGIVFEAIDALAAYEACVKALADALDDRERGRAAYQLGRTIESADTRGMALPSIDFTTYYRQAIDLGYAMALNNVVPETVTDAEYLPTQAAHFNAVMAAAGPALASRLEAAGTKDGLAIATWLRSEVAAIGDRRSHRFVPAATAAR